MHGEDPDGQQAERTDLEGNGEVGTVSRKRMLPYLSLSLLRCWGPSYKRDLGMRTLDDSHCLNVLVSRHALA